MVLLCTELLSTASRYFPNMRGAIFTQCILVRSSPLSILSKAAILEKPNTLPLLIKAPNVLYSRRDTPSTILLNLGRLGVQEPIKRWATLLHNGGFLWSKLRILFLATNLVTEILSNHFSFAYPLYPASFPSMSPVPSLLSLRGSGTTCPAHPPPPVAFYEVGRGEVGPVLGYRTRGSQNFGAALWLRVLGRAVLPSSTHCILLPFLILLTCWILY